jgi:hypothetical protein
MRVSARVFVRHSCHYTCGILSFTFVCQALLVDEPRDQVGKLQQISNSERRATLADHDLWIGRNHVGPLPWHRVNVVLVNAQQEPRPVPVVSLADAGELPSAERVKWVGHAYKVRVRVRRACSSS